MTAEVRITGIAAGGAGVGRLPDGRAIFVHRTAPGEAVRVAVTGGKRRWATGRLLRVLEPSPARRKAPCPHYDHCGGCTLEHMVYDAQLEAKASIVSEALARIGGTPIDAPVVVPSPREFQYRNRVSFTFIRTARGPVAGFHDIDRPDRVVDISAACLLPEPAIAEAWGQLREAWGDDASNLPSGERLRLTLRASASGDVGLVINGGYSHGRPERLLEAVPRLTAIWHRRADRDRFEAIAGSERFGEEWQEEEIGLSGTVFLQVNRALAEVLEAYVIERATAGVSVQTVVDAYCGIGLHARRLARLGLQVVGIELDEAAVDEARRAAPENTTFVAGRVEERLPEFLPADLVIANPPRAGLDAAAAEALAKTPPKRILYVSCDPATLARDIRRLEATHRLTSVRCFDLFPQTSHVETVAELECVTS